MLQMPITCTRKKVFKYFELKVLGEYYNLHVQINRLMLAEVFENFGNSFLEIHDLDPEKFLSALGLAWQAAFKKTK